VIIVIRSAFGFKAGPLVRKSKVGMTRGKKKSAAAGWQAGLAAGLFGGAALLTLFPITGLSILLAAMTVGGATAAGDLMTRKRRKPWGWIIVLGLVGTIAALAAVAAGWLGPGQRGYLLAGLAAGAGGAVTVIGTVLAVAGRRSSP
jgi:hypothetical protein